MKVLIIEPCFFGLGYIQAARALGLECWAVTSDATHPDQYNYRDQVRGVLVCPVNDAQAVKHALDEADLLPTIAAVVAGNQFVTVTAAKLVALLGLRGVPALAAECGVHKDLARHAYRQAGHRRSTTHWSRPWTMREPRQPESAIRS